MSGDRVSYNYSTEERAITHPWSVYLSLFLPLGATFSERYLGLPAKEEHAYSVRLRGFYMHDCLSHLKTPITSCRRFSFFF